jgi:hypothetical protein
MTAACVLMLSSCGGGVDSPPSHALWVPGTDHRLCMSSASGNRFTDGLDVLANRGPAPVTVTAWNWQDAEGLELLDVSYFERLPTDRFATYGALSGFPPDDLATDSSSFTEAWERRKPLRGATLPESDGKSNYFNIIIGFSGVKGGAGPLRISYIDGDGNDGVVETRVRLTIRPHCF